MISSGKLSGEQAATAAFERRVLLIDDSEDFMWLVKSAMDAFGNGQYCLSWAKTLQAGLQEVESQRLDVVLLDLGLPESSGELSYMLVRNAVASKHVDQFPIVVLTGDENGTTKDAVLAGGAHDYLIKQIISAPSLLKVIDTAMQKTATGTHRSLTGHEHVAVHKILLIEDDEDAMLLVEYALGKYGRGRFQMEWVTSLQAGAERLSLGGFDLVLLDLGLPDSVGCEGYLQLKKIAGEVPIVVLSANTSMELEFAVLACGADDYLDKRLTSGSELTRLLNGVLQVEETRRQMKARHCEVRPRSKSFWGV